MPEMKPEAMLPMTRRRFYVPRDLIQNESAQLPPDQSHHLRDVLRIGAGESVEIFDGEGVGYVGEVTFEDSTVAVRHLQKLPSEQPRIPLILAAALIRPVKFEWLLQKSTELGVHEIIPLQTRRSEIRMASNRVVSRYERWNRIVREASRQCGRSYAPRIRLPLEYSSLLHSDEFSDFPKILFSETVENLWRPEPGGFSNGLVLCTGPEGGWEEGEIEEANRAGYRIFSLGPWVLRAETAAITALSIIQYHINLQSSGDSSGKNPLI